MFDYLLNEEQLEFRKEVQDFVAQVPLQIILDMDEEKIRFPKEFLQEAGRRNLMGCRYPKKWGGRDLDWPTTAMVMEEVGTLGYIFACTFGVGAELVCDAIIQHGTDYQKERYVKPLLAGEKFAAECLTEPRGGSDFFGATTVAEDKGDYFILNGQKRFIVGAEGADYFLVYARTNTDPNAPPQKALTAFIVDRTDDVRVDYIYGLMGCRGGGTGRIVFDNVKVPKENVLGEVNGAYPVFNTMMIPERLGTSAMTIGPARSSLDVATRYTSRRKQFGQTINRFQGVSFQVADAAKLVDASRSQVHTTTLAVEAGIDYRRVRRLICETKKFVTESCQEAVRNCMQVMGGIGYTNVYPIERHSRDLGLASIWVGTNEVMSVVAAHEWYREYEENRKAMKERDYEHDAAEAHAEDEKIYE